MTKTNKITKKWYTSKTIIGWIISVLTMASFVAEMDLDTWMITETVQTVFSAIWAIMVFVWRIKSETKLR